MIPLTRPRAMPRPDVHPIRARATVEVLLAETRALQQSERAARERVVELQRALDARASTSRANDAEDDAEDDGDGRRDARVTSRALTSARDRAGTLAIELRDARMDASRWKARAEDAMETSEANARACERFRMATAEAQRATEALETALAEANASRERALETTSIERGERERAEKELAYVRDALERALGEKDEAIREVHARCVAAETRSRALGRAMKRLERDRARWATRAHELERTNARDDDDRALEDEARRLERARARCRGATRRGEAERDAATRARDDADGRLARGRLRPTRDDDDDDDDEDDDEDDEDDDEDDGDERASSALAEAAVDDFFAEDDAEDARIDADRARARALARRLERVRTRVVGLFS